MSKLSDVQFSQEGEKGRVQSNSSFTPEDSIVRDLRQESDDSLSTKVHCFKLVNNNRKGGVYIPNIDDVIRPVEELKNAEGVVIGKVGGGVERMRLLAGVDTVWQKDQKELTPLYINQNGRSISFPRGVRMIQIPEWDKTALTFARLCSHNIGSKSRKAGSKFEFYEYNPAKEQEEALHREEFELDMAIEAKNMPAEKMKKHANFLGIRATDDYGFAKTDDGIRREYVIYAKRNPELFNKTKGSKEVEINWLVRKAISDAKIEVNREPGKIYWANGGGLICHCPATITPDRHLTDLALTPSEDGIRFKEQLEQFAT